MTLPKFSPKFPHPNHLTTAHPVPTLSPTMRLALLLLVVSCTQPPPSDDQTSPDCQPLPTTTDRDTSCRHACQLGHLSNRSGQCCAEPAVDPSACADRCVDECLNGTAAGAWCP